MSRTLKIDILGDSSGAEKALKKTSDSLEKVGPSAKVANGALDNVSSTLTNKLGPAAPLAQGALDKLGLTAGGLGSTIGIGMAAGVAAGGAALAKFALDGVQNFVALASEVRNFQRASGASAETSSKWVAVADDMGIESEKLSTSLFKLGKTVGANDEALEKHGVTVARNKDGGVDLTETTLNIADAFTRTTDPAKRAELATAAFGKAGKDLLPVLEQGREGLAKFFEGAEGNRQILSQKDLETAREYELAMDALGDATSGLQRGLGSGLVPVLADVASGAAAVVSGIDAASEKVGGLGGIVKSVASVAAPGVALLGLLGGKSKDAAEEQEKHATAATHAAEALDDERLSTDEQSKALDNLLSATQAQFSSQIAFERSLNGLEDAQAKVTEATKAQTEAIKAHGPQSAQAKAAAEELSRAQLGSKEAALQVAAAAVRQAEDQAKANGVVLTSVEKNELYKAKLGEVRDTLAPGSPLRGALEGYIATLERAPDKLETVVTADVSQAERTLREFRQRQQSMTTTLNMKAGVTTGPLPGRPAGAAGGGVFRATPGGVPLTVAEGGTDEAVVTLRSGGKIPVEFTGGRRPMAAPARGEQGAPPPIVVNLSPTIKVEAAGINTYDQQRAVAEVLKQVFLGPVGAQLANTVFVAMQRAGWSFPSMKNVVGGF